MKGNVPQHPTPPNAQHKYRDKQTREGLVRYELQVHQDTKARFEAIVATIADELEQPYDRRRRLALARAKLLDDLVGGISHEFYTLKEQITVLKGEITALSPTFMANAGNNVSIPSIVQALPNEPQQLKQLLANSYHQQQSLQLQLKEIKRVTNQYKALYEAASQ